MPHSRVQSPGKINVMIVPHYNSIRHIENRFRHILFIFVFFNAVWALTTRGFLIVSDTLVRTRSSSVAERLRDASCHFIPPCIRCPARGGGPRQSTAIPFGMETLEWSGDGEKTLMICLAVSTECRRVTDRQTDRHLAYASRCRNLCDVCSADFRPRPLVTGRVLAFILSITI